MQNFRFIGAMVSEFRFFKRRRRRTWTICENYVYLYFIPPVIFSSIFLHAVTFSHVLHPDVLKGQIGLKLKVKTEISLCMAIYNAEQPIAIPIYTVLPYCVIYNIYYIHT